MQRLITSFILALTASAQAAKIDIIGLRSYTEKQLLESIAGRLEYIKKREATPQRADDAAFLVESYLQLHGLPEAAVDWSIQPNGTIQLTVNEGPPKFLGEVTVTGLEKPEKAIEQFQGAFPGKEESRAFVSDSQSSGTSRVIDLLNSEGYWAATATASPLPRDAGGRIPMKVTVQRGPLFKLALPKIESSIPPGPDLSAQLATVNGTPATSETIIKIRKSVHEHYLKRGYADSTIEMSKEISGSTL